MGYGRLRAPSGGGAVARNPALLYENVRMCYYNWRIEVKVKPIGKFPVGVTTIY